MENIPEFVAKEDGIEYSDWVAGVYPQNTLCMYRVVRAIRQKGRVTWEYASDLGENEDLFDIPAPDSWLPFLV